MTNPRTSGMKPNRVDAAVALIIERHKRQWDALPDTVRNAFRRWAATYAHVNPEADALDIAIAGLSRIGIVGRCDGHRRLAVPSAAWANARA